MQLVLVLPRPLSTVLAQDHFYSDFLSLLLTKQIHFESVMMIASAQHSLSVLASVKLMIECVVHLLSRFPSYSNLLLSDVFWRLWERATSEQQLMLLPRYLGAAPLPISQSSILRARHCSQMRNWRAPRMFRFAFWPSSLQQLDYTFSAFWI